MNEDVLSYILDLQDRTEHLETIDQPLPEIVPPFLRARGQTP